VGVSRGDRKKRAAITRSRLGTFRSNVLDWYAANGRDLPWRRTRDPYAIVVSEIMLHQTQVSRVIPFYERFLRKYPTVEALARARRRDVKSLTDPLGYKVRGRWLHAIAQHVAEERAGYFPQSIDELRRLPGVGRYTAGALMSFAFHRDAPILDTNVARLLSRYFGAQRSRGELWALASRVIPPGKAYVFNQALMDVGALVCVSRAPRCLACPLRRGCRMLHA